MKRRGFLEANLIGLLRLFLKIGHVPVNLSNNNVVVKRRDFGCEAHRGENANGGRLAT